MARISVVSLLLVLLVVCSCVVTVSATNRLNRHGKHWIVMEVDATRDWDQQACLSFDFRGRYGDFGLLVGDSRDLSRARRFEGAHPDGTNMLIPHEKGQELWVVECPPKYGITLVNDVKSAAEANYLPILYHHQDASGKTSYVIKGDISSLAHLSAAFISVPSSAQQPLVEHAVQEYQHRVSAPDEVIEKLVAQVSQDELRGNVEKLSSFFTRLATSITGDNKVLAAQQYLEQRFADLGLSVSTFPFRVGYSSNVIGELKGSEDPDRIVIVSAHYDCRTTSFDPNLRAPGADDNGSGSANVLELARVFTESKLKFKYTLRFCLWSGEEQGLYGSRAYASKMKQDGENIIAVLNGDMLGWTLPRTNITLGMSDRYISKALNDLVNGITRTYVPSIGIGPTSACCSDHQSFFENGYPAVGYAENTGLYTDYPYYHRSNDLPEHLNFVQITLISKAIAAAAATLAIPDTN